MLTIRRKILLGCLALTAVTVLFGAFAQTAQRDLGAVATRLYDEAFLAMSYLRSAQNGLMRAEAQYRRPAASDAPASDAPAPGGAVPGGAVPGGAVPGGAVPEAAAPDEAARVALAAALTDIEADLQVAAERAMSPDGHAAIERLRARLSELSAASDAGRGAALAAMPPAEAAFDTAVEVYAADGYRHRREAEGMVERAALRNRVAMAVSVAVALAITVLLSRSIVPALREAVGVAQAIAAGRLDNPIRDRGRDEAGQLLRALGTMQDSIAAALARIRALMDEQASSHAGEIAAQHARFDAALSNMSQGLCLFGPDGRLLVANRRFAEMFGIAPRAGADPAEVFAGGGLPALLGPERPGERTHARGRDGTSGRRAGAEAAFSCDLPDDRSIAVAHRPVAGGGWVATYEDVTERRHADARLAHMARHDVLTGLPNRLLFREHMQRALARLRRGGGGLAVLCLDLDRFKAVNDALGHAVGDAVLRAAAGRLLACVRETDLVARLGGDEFAVVQEDAAQPTDATALARRLVEALSAPFDVEGHQVVVGTSIGVALVDEGAPGGGPDPDALLKCADLALYRAKAEGGGTWSFFEEEMDARMQERRRLEMDLRRALASGQFEVFYQPLVEAGGGKISGFEALLRWRHPERGLVSPMLFIPLAEEIGLIGPIGAWVLRQACADVASWPGRLKVAVNLSAVQFRNRALADEVAGALAETGLDPSRLELEVTESLLLGDDAAVLAVLHELRRLGVRIAMDDFGTGYSSLSYLRRFPFDKIKIDQSFVRGLGERDDCDAIVRAVIGLGRSLGMTVNAEGVETPEQFTALRVEGCAEVQGYLFSEPRPAGDVPALLRRHGNTTLPSPEQGAPDGAVTGPLHRVVYCSRNVIADAHDDVAREVERILDASRRNNARDGITGALLYGEGCFAQVLEGPAAAIERTFERIQCDFRHADVVVLESGAVQTRLFGDWSMAYGGALGPQAVARLGLKRAFSEPRSLAAEAVVTGLQDVVRGQAGTVPA